MKMRRLKLKFRIPPYITPRNLWRIQIYTIAKRCQVAYEKKDRLQIDVRLYLSGSDIFMHDVDNRLKDILDALQGRVGGPKSIRRFKAIIPNDNQIFRVTLEKLLPPRQSHGFGHIMVSKYVSSIKGQ